VKSARRRLRSPAPDEALRNCTMFAESFPIIFQPIRMFSRS
jgi:hypothetical protein